MRASLVALAAVLAATTAGAEGVFGVWQTQATDDGRYLQVETKPCADDSSKVCGAIVGAFGGARADSVGKPMIWDMVPDGPNTWDDGRIWKPDEDKIYDAGMKLQGDVLKVSGCILGGLICKSQKWPRVR